MQLRSALTTAIFFLVFLLTSCVTTPPPAVPAGPPNLLDLDPRTGASQTATESLRKRYDSALAEMDRGRIDVSTDRLAVLQQKNPDYRPIEVAMARAALRAGDVEKAGVILARVLAKEPEYFAARAYSAEVALRTGDLAAAYATLQSLSSSPSAPPVVGDVFSQTRTAYFDQLFARANATADPEESIALLRQSLSIVPEADTARELLVRKLIDAKRFDDARRQVEPLLQRKPEAEEVDWALAEIDVGKGRYQDAIVRYDRLVRRDAARYGARLAEIKQKFLEANMPPQYLGAMASNALTRAELSVLLYWKLSAVRFAQNLGQPPIAIDVAGVQEGRDEFVRSLALRLFTVDPVMRTAGPDRLVTSGQFLRLASRLLELRGKPPCARDAAGEDELARAIRALNACAVPLGRLPSQLDQPVTGKEAALALDAIERIFVSTEQ